MLTGTIGAYTTSGATVNAALISGLDLPFGIAVSGSDLFVANIDGGTIGEYTTAGATVNAALISGLDLPTDVAIALVPEFSTWTMLLPGLRPSLLRGFAGRGPEPFRPRGFVCARPDPPG